MKQKLYKLSFDSKEQWEAFRDANLLEEENGIKSVILGAHLQYFNPNVMNPETGEEGAWDTRTDYAVDVLTEADYDGSVFEPYLITEKEKYSMIIPNNDADIVVSTDTPDMSWLKADIQSYLDAEGIVYTASMTKQELIDLI